MILQVAYGSETGCAEDVATNLHRRLKYYLDPDVESRVCSLNDYQFVFPSVAIIVCSTCGQGDPPLNAKSFWKSIMSRSCPQDLFSDVEYSLLGLGDSAYTKFNFVAKKLFRRIQMLRGKSIFDLQLADEQHEHGSDFQSEIFIADCLKALSTRFNFQLESPTIPLELPLPCTLKLKYLPTNEDNAAADISWKHCCPYKGSLDSVARVTSEDHFQKTILARISFESSKKSESMKPGDVLAIQPVNPISCFNLFCELFPQISMASKIMVADISDQWISIEYLITNVLDLSSIPRRSFFEVMSKLSNDEDEREKLMEIFTDQEMFYSYCCRPRRSILEVFRDFPKTTSSLSLERIIEYVPRIKERNFSMASVITKQGTDSSFVELLVAVVKFQTKIQQPRLGLCSNFLADSEIPQKVMIDFRKGSFSLPQNQETPLIMIGPGTGVAPFRSVVQHRNGRKCFLFFGCRHPEKDFYFKEEWRTNFPDLKVFPSFSRYLTDKVCYVQHKLIEEKQLVWKLISNEDAFVYLAGSSKQMPKDVKEVLVEIIADLSETSLEEAKLYLEGMEKSRKFQEETW